MSPKRSAVAYRMSQWQTSRLPAPSRPRLRRGGNEDKVRRIARRCSAVVVMTPWRGGVGTSPDGTTMTKNSARKKAIRARQAATGEAYTAARRRLAEQDQGQAEPPRLDPVVTGGPWVSSWDGDPLHDVNPACGHHRRALCGGCGVCTTCDGCYCAELAAEAAMDAEAERDAREHLEHDEHRADCLRCERERADSADYTRCPACGLTYPDGRGDHLRHTPPYCSPLPAYPLGIDWGYLRGQHVTLVGRDYSVHGLVLACQDAPDPRAYYPYMRMRRTDPGYEDGPDEASPFNPREWLEVQPAPAGM